MFSTNSLSTQFFVTYLCMTKLVLHGLIPPESSQASSKHPRKTEIVKTSVASCHEFFLTLELILKYKVVQYYFIFFCQVPWLSSQPSFAGLLSSCSGTTWIWSMSQKATGSECSPFGWSTATRSLIHWSTPFWTGASGQKWKQPSRDLANKLRKKLWCLVYHQNDRTLAKYRTVKNAMTAKWIQNNEAQSDNAVCLPNWANGTDQHFQIDCTCCRTRQLNGSY